jgi:hypothetical protein
MHGAMAIDAMFAALSRVRRLKLAINAVFAALSRVRRLKLAINAVFAALSRVRRLKLAINAVFAALSRVRRSKLAINAVFAALSRVRRLKLAINAVFVAFEPAHGYLECYPLGRSVCICRRAAVELPSRSFCSAPCTRFKALFGNIPASNTETFPCLRIIRIRANGYSRG